MNGSERMNSWVMRLIFLNIIIFFLQELTSGYVEPIQIPYGGRLFEIPMQMSSYYFGLIPGNIIEKGYIWQLFTYMFLHGSLLHIFVNMYALLIFGISIEQAWGIKRFLFYYLFTGTGAGIVIFIINMIVGGTSYYASTIGASGAVFGLLLAFGILFPDAEILLFFFIPLKAKFLVILYGGLELYALISSGGQSNISHVGHLGGLLFGLIYFALFKKRLIVFKSKMFRIKHAQKNIMDKYLSESEKSKNELLKIYQKAKASGFNSLSDDEIQFIKFKEIMIGEIKNLCNDEEFIITDDDCAKCNNQEACLIREIKNTRGTLP